MSTNPTVPTSRRRGEKDADPTADWTAATEAPAEPAEPHKKLSLNIPASVHQAEKIGAATRGNTMLAEVIEMLRARNGLAPWPADVVEAVKAQIAAHSDEKPASAGHGPGPAAREREREEWTPTTASPRPAPTWWPIARRAAHAMGCAAAPI